MSYSMEIKRIEPSSHPRASWVPAGFGVRAQMEPACELSVLYICLAISVRIDCSTDSDVLLCMLVQGPTRQAHCSRLH